MHSGRQEALEAFSFQESLGLSSGLLVLRCSTPNTMSRIRIGMTLWAASVLFHAWEEQADRPHHPQDTQHAHYAHQLHHPHLNWSTLPPQYSSASYEPNPIASPDLDDYGVDEVSDYLEDFEDEEQLLTIM